MAKKTEWIDPEQAQRDLTFIKRCVIGILVVVALFFGLSALQAWQFKQRAEQDAEIDKYIKDHTPKVRALFEKDEVLTLERLAFGGRSEKGQTSTPQIELNVHVSADPAKPLADLAQRADALKSEIDKLLLDPPYAAKVRLVVTSKLVRE